MLKAFLKYDWWFLFSFDVAIVQSKCAKMHRGSKWKWLKIIKQSSLLDDRKDGLPCWYLFSRFFLVTIGPHERGKHAHHSCFAVTKYPGGSNKPTWNGGNINSSHIRLEYTWQHPELEACKKLNRSTIKLTGAALFCRFLLGEKLRWFLYVDGAEDGCKLAMSSLAWHWLSCGFSIWLVPWQNRSFRMTWTSRNLIWSLVYQ